MLKLGIQLPISIFREDKHYIAYTPVLDLSTSAKSYEEVKKRFHEVVAIFFEELIKKGTLEEVLMDLWWKKVDKKWTPPTLISQESEKFELAVK